MNWRLRLNGALYRKAMDKAGDDKSLAELVTKWLTAYVEGTSPQAKGGKATAAAMTDEERTARASHAAKARWTKDR